MSVLMNNSTNGLGNGLVVLRDLVTVGSPSIRNHSFAERAHDGSDRSSSLRVVSRNIEELIKD